MVKVYTNVLPKEKYNQFSFGPRDIMGITIHETGNTLSALENIEIMASSRHNYSANVFIDETGAYEAIPLSMSSMHTGKAKDRGNINTISIEICRSKSNDDTYNDSKNNAIAYIKDLLKKYNLKWKNIYFHNDFDSKFYCPHRILFDYGDKKTFIQEVFQ